MKKDIFWNSIGTAAWSFLSLFLLIAVTRINGVTDSGLFSFSFAFAMIMFTVCCYGGRAYQVSDHHGSFSVDNYISLRIFTSIGVLLLTVCFVLINGYGIEKSILLLLLVGHRVFDAIADVFYGVMQKKSQLHISGKSLFYKSIISIFAFIVIDLLTRNILLASLSLPIISLLFVAFYDIPHSRRLETFTISFKLADLKVLLRSTFLSFSVAVMGLIFANLARYFIDLYHPNLQGYFGIIVMPLSVIILLFSFILNPAILHMSNAYNNGELQLLRRTTRNIIYILTIFATTLALFMYFLSTPLLKLLFNVDFTSYTLDIILVVLIGFILSVTSLFTNVAIIARKLRFTAIMYLLCNIVLIVLCITFVEQLQIHGAILAYVIASITQAIAMGCYYIVITRHQKSSKKV